jgi:hypothetical protein
MTGLGRSTRAMAVGTIASRGTGLLRNVVLVAVLGLETVGAAFNVANTAPNIVYELLLGGVLTSVVVPLLVRAAKDDGDGGQAYAQRLLTLVVVVLGGASVLLVLAAPWIVDLYADDLSREGRELATVFARYFLPQVLFYGIGAVLGAVLNTRGRYAPPMWAPVLNNLVVITTGLAFLAVRGGDALTPESLTPGQLALLGVGTTLGIVAQTVALVPSLRAAGFSLRPRWDFRELGLRRVARWPVGAAVRRRQPAGLPGRGEPRDRRRPRRGRPRLPVVRLRLPAVLAAARRRRGERHHRAAAQDEPGGCGRSDRGPAHLAQPRACGSPPPCWCRPPSPSSRSVASWPCWSSPATRCRWTTPASWACCSGSSPSAWCRSAATSSSCGPSTRCRTPARPR